jgi:putative SOS response-associated peptidase YedK
MSEHPLQEGTGFLFWQEQVAHVPKSGRVEREEPSFEWQRRDGAKQPYYIRLKDGRPFAIAGLWDRWHSPEGEVVESCTILTTEANAVVRPIHDRMPVIVDPADYERWLDPKVQKPELVQPLLRPYREDDQTAYPVTWVNSPKNNGPKCAEPLGPTG